MQLARWGNSLAIRIPVSVVETLDLEEGDEIQISVYSKSHFGVERKPAGKSLAARLKALEGKLPPDFRFDRTEANAR